MITIATSATRLSPSVQKSSPFSAMCVRWLKKQKSLCAFAARIIATVTPLLMMAASSPAQNGGCLTLTQAGQTWAHSHLYWHTERHCWDVTPGGQYHRSAYGSSAPALTERQTALPAVNYQVVKKDGGTASVKPPVEVTTYYRSLMTGQNADSGWLTPTPVFDWSLLIDIDRRNRFAPWDRMVSATCEDARS
jgi:hypothetical protein